MLTFSWPMRATRLGAGTLAAVALSAAGCGGGGPRAPQVSSLPLISGASVIAQAEQCDRGANAYCAVQLVIVDHRFRTSTELMKAERRQLTGLGWSLANGDTGNEHAADSPGHRLRVTYATPEADLQGIDLGWIKRPRRIALALSEQLFARSPALSIMLEKGSG
jgi:hypothetical protein